jgi:hypothetical protein
MKSAHIPNQESSSKRDRESIDDEEIALDSSMERSKRFDDPRAPRDLMNPAMHGVTQQILLPCFLLSRTAV